jgi:protease-4
LWKRLLLTLFVLAFLGSMALNFLLVLIVGLSAAEGERRVQEKHLSHNRAAADKVAVIAVEGVIMQGEDGFVKRQIDRVAEDENVKAVVLRVDSPGGSVSASDYIHHHLREMLKKRKIPMVVSMGGIAASGGYYVSMAVGHSPNVIFAEPTCFTGSIGVIIPHYNLGEMLGKIGVAEDSVASGPLKEMGTLSRAMTAQERTLFQGLVDDSFSRFKEIIRSGRLKFQKDPAALDKLATGQVFAADRAKENGLVLKQANTEG